MRRSASEIIRNLETRIARLEKSARGELTKKVVAELEDLLSDHPFNDSDPHREEYYFTIEPKRAKELEFMEEMSSRGNENAFYSKYEVEATITLNSIGLIRDSATIENPRVKLYHLVDEALEQANFDGARGKHLRVTGEVEVKHIGTPKLITRASEPTLVIPVKVVLIAENSSDFFQ